MPRSVRQRRPARTYAPTNNVQAPRPRYRDRARAPQGAL